MISRTLSLTAGGALLAALLLSAGPASAEGKKIVLAIPGVPPIYSATIAYVAEKQGLFEKHGADVEIRPFDNGTAAARAVVAGDIDRAWSPTPPVIVQISNADVPLVGIYGMPNPRTRATLREPRFAELREQVWGTLMREAREAEFVLER